MLQFCYGGNREICFMIIEVDFFFSFKVFWNVPMVKVDQSNCHGWLIYFSLVRLVQVIDINLNAAQKVMTSIRKQFFCSQINITDFQQSIKKFVFKQAQ